MKLPFLKQSLLLTSVLLNLLLFVRLQLWTTLSPCSLLLTTSDIGNKITQNALFSSSTAVHSQNRSTSSSSSSVFQQVYNITYSLASNSGAAKKQDSKNNNHHSETAAPFLNLTEWKAMGYSGGGLSDWDRLKLYEIYRNAHSVFEYGLGESTKIAAHVNVPRYVGIDSDAQWVAMARQGSPLHFRFAFADVGELKGWGTAKDTNADKNFFNYQVAPLAVEQGAFDVYMVDGRWRAACALVSFLHAADRGRRRGMNENKNAGADVLVLIHDFVDKEKSTNCQRPANCNVQSIRLHYHRIKQVADMVDHSTNKLAVFRRKENVTDQQIFDLWREMMILAG